MIPYQAMVNKYVWPIIRRHEQRGEERGRKQGEQTQQQLWEEWLRSKTEHEEQGIPFDEPPPSLNGNTPD